MNQFPHGFIGDIGITTSYHCLVGVAPLVPGLEVGELNLVRDEGLSATVTTTADKVMFFVCIKSYTTSHWPTRIRFSDTDAEKEAAKIADFPVTTHVLFGEIWSRRQRGYLCPIEEGLLKHWHWGRLALVGDSAHKVPSSYPMV